MRIFLVNKIMKQRHGHQPLIPGFSLLNPTLNLRRGGMNVNLWFKELYGDSLVHTSVKWMKLSSSEDHVIHPLPWLLW
jgi:hypothetical protein